MITDFYSEVFDTARNGVLPPVKTKEALEQMHATRAITNTKEHEMEQWFEDASAAFISINPNQTLKTLIRF